MKLPRFLIEFTGHTMVHKYPPWFVYRPNIHKVRGSDVRMVLDVVRKGDILLRRYDNYLNTIFTPGYYSHAGLYVGDNQVVHAVSQGVISEDILSFCRCDAVCVLTVVGATWETITSAIDKAKAAADENIEYDFNFCSSNKTYYCTELVDIAYHNIFLSDYIEKMGQLILMPDGIRYSDRVRVKLENKP